MGDTDANSMYEQTTRGILVRAVPEYRSDHSDPDEPRYVWSYMIEIENHGVDTVQLISRRWTITNARGHTQEVEGEGVVGQQPVLRPGDAFRYVSGAPLDTPSGIMQGAYLMRTDDGDEFTVAIPAFSLDSPDELGLSRPN